MVKCYDWEDTLMNAEQYRAVIGWFNARPAAKKGAAARQPRGGGAGISALPRYAGVAGTAPQ